jgi:hypothetical protein
MYTRSAIFSGTVKAEYEDEFYLAVAERLLPAWRQMLHATEVRLYRPVRRDDGTPEVFLVQEIDYPSLEAIDEALQSPRRELAREALESVQHMYDGYHYHYVYRKIGV